MTRAKPAAGMHMFYLEGTGVLFCESSRELHLLNATGALIWSLLEEGHDESSARDTLCEIGGLDTERSTRFVAAALAQWREAGFLEDGPREPSPEPVRAPLDDLQSDAEPWREQLVVVERRYRLLATTFDVRFSATEQADEVSPALAHLEDSQAPAHVVIDIAHSPGALTVYADRVPYARCASHGELAPILKALLWTTAVNRQDFLLDIHAGVVGDGTRCILLPAPAGSGKSTLTAALVHAGCVYFSDEVALLEAGTFDVLPLPLAMCIKESGIEALASEFPALRDLPLHRRRDGKRVAYLPPPAVSLPSTDEARPVAALVFPRFAADAAISLVELPKPAALKRLLDECLVIRKPLELSHVRGLLDWLARTPCYALTYGSAGEGAGAILRAIPLAPAV